MLSLASGRCFDGIGVARVGEIWSGQFTALNLNLLTRENYAELSRPGKHDAFLFTITLLQSVRLR